MILHVDMDAFYASVEIREDPSLQGKPVVVGGSVEGRGVVSAASYEARKFGIHSAMPASQAKKHCPNAIFLPPRISLYAKVSEQIHEIFQQYTPLIEPLSLDEAFLDTTGSEKLFGTSEEIGHHIKNDISNQLNLVASVGVAPNKFLAKIASDLDKPNGFVVVSKGREKEFLSELSVKRLWGVGKATKKVFDRLGIQKIGQLQQIPQEVLHDHLGNTGDHLWNLAHGFDNRSVVTEREIKSVSNETTFSQNISDLELIKAWAMHLTEQVSWRMRRKSHFGKTVQVKVRFADFHTITRSVTLDNATHSTQLIWTAVDEILSNRLPKYKDNQIRLIGVGVSNLSTRPTKQKDLFSEQESQTQAIVDQAADQIREKFGLESLHRASSLVKKPKNPEE